MMLLIKLDLVFLLKSVHSGIQEGKILVMEYRLRRQLTG